jgi:hypothetical protein
MMGGPYPLSPGCPLAWPTWPAAWVSRPCAILGAPAGRADAGLGPSGTRASWSGWRPSPLGCTTQGVRGCTGAQGYTPQTGWHTTPWGTGTIHAGP